MENTNYIIKDGIKYLEINGRLFKVLAPDEPFSKGKVSEELEERRKENKKWKKDYIQSAMEEGLSRKEAEEKYESMSGACEDYSIQEICDGKYDDDPMPEDYKAYRDYVD